MTAQHARAVRCASAASAGILVIASCALLAQPATADELPMRKAGLWELTMNPAQPGMPAVQMRHCTDESVDRQMSAMSSPMAKDMCKQTSIQKTAAGFAVDSVCGTGGMTTTSHAEITGNFQSAYTVKITAHVTGGPMGNHDTNMTMDARWTGACPADLKPGDIVMPGGMKMNVKAMEAFRPPSR